MRRVELSNIKLIEVKEVPPEHITKVYVICDNCGHLNYSNVKIADGDVTKIISRINDELDTAKTRIERILNEKA